MIDSYDKLTIGKYLEIKDVINSDMDGIDKNVELICILGDYDEDTVLELPVISFNRLLQSTGFLYEECKPNKISTKYRLGNTVLETTIDLNKMTTSQFIDYQTFIKDERYMIDLLSVFLIPEGRNYNDGYDIGEVKKVIRDNLNIRDAMGISAFFLLLFQSLFRSTATCSIRKLRKMMRKEKDMKVKKMYQKAIENLEASGAF